MKQAVIAEPVNGGELMYKFKLDKKENTSFANFDEKFILLRKHICMTYQLLYSISSIS